MGASDSVEPFLDGARLALLDRLPEIVVVADAEARMRWANRTMLDLMGYRLDEIEGKSIFDFVHPDDLTYMLWSWDKRRDHEGDSGLIVQGRARNRDGSWRACEVIGLSLLDEPDVGVMVITARDLTHQSALADSPARLRSLVDRTTDVVLLVDGDGDIVYANRRLTTLLGHDSDRVVGHPWTAMVDPDDRDRAEAWFRHLVDAGDGAHTRLQLGAADPRGRRIEVELQGTNQLADPLIEGVILALRDVGELVEMQRALEEQNARLAHLASHDSLTGLLNRVAFVDAVQAAIDERSGPDAGSDPDGAEVVVLFTDLDGFKLVNDEHGHEVGDRVLQEIARRFDDTVGASGSVARYGGDEFTVLLSRDDPPHLVSNLVARLTNAITEPVVLDGITARVGVSIGVSRAPAAGTDVDSLLSAADRAMYERKREGRGA